MYSRCTEVDFIEKYNQSICSGDHGYVDLGSSCHQLDKIMLYSNDSDVWDPHQCTNSCKDPGYGCLACSNTDFFRCFKNNQSVCIHPDLYCNQHPDCNNAEDEKYENCIEHYVDKLIVNEFATLRCKSENYQNIETLATVCDDIIECHDREDEPESCRRNDANMYLVISVSCILAMYLGLNYYLNYRD